MTSDIRKMLDDEAREAEERAGLEEKGVVPPLPGQRARRQPSAPSQVYTIRIPLERLEELRRLAERIGEAPSALLRKWALERLDEEAGRSTNAQSSEEKIAFAVVAALLDRVNDEGGAIVIGTQESSGNLDVHARMRRAPRLGPVRRLTTGLSAIDIDLDPAVDTQEKARP